ncbi:coiled-coil domain-containing protein 28A isoform X2 [Frankliniella occidentalis]|uniref:Coiled-coil domain-containing protein 28A isoform X2 n=1 Tax=Frankliniella occidentalis TaxID=133901 RepID=A0A6J1TDX3_FRAOC|nr:coiled-coil domain-containing protein 28A isoform X2 [Frankliniella occidentalis]
MSKMPTTSETEMSPKDDVNEDENLNPPPPNPESIMANRLDEGCELQQLVGDDDEVRGGATPPVSPTICRITQTSPSTPNSTKVSTPAGPDSVRSSTAAGPSPSHGTSLGSGTSRSLSRIATAPTMSSVSNGPNTRLLYVNEKLSRGPSLISEHGGTRPPRDRNPKTGQNAPRAEIKRGATSIGLTSTGSHSQLSHLLNSRSRLTAQDSRSALRYRMRDPDRSCEHHCFLTDVTDVHRMEEALLHLLEDFHTGKLRAFGKDCSMEQMTGIREQQERLARLHFDLGAQGELFSPLSDEGLRAGQEYMQSLMGSLEQLSVSIERLHSFSESRESSQKPE